MKPRRSRAYLSGQQAPLIPGFKPFKGNAPLSPTTASKAPSKTPAKPRVRRAPASAAKADKPSTAKAPGAQPAGVKAAAGRKPAASGRPDAKAAVKIILARLEDIKADDPIVIDLTGKTTMADAMIVASGTSTRHVAAVADNIIEGLEKAGVKGIRVEGKKNGDWVLIDAGDVIVHVFRPEVRSFYDIEKMWAGAAATRARKSD